MNNIYRILTVALLTSITFLPAKAETINTTAELNKNKAAIEYIYSRPLMERLFRLGLEEDKKFILQQDCKSQYQTIPVSSILLKPIVFTENSPNPVGGVWITRYRFVRCGDEKIYNALVLADTTGGIPIGKSFFAGATNAGPNLFQMQCAQQSRMRRGK